MINVRSTFNVQRSTCGAHWLGPKTLQLRAFRSSDTIYITCTLPVFVGLFGVGNKLRFDLRPRCWLNHALS
jgi:hypothetical protein